MIRMKILLQLLGNTFLLFVLPLTFVYAQPDYDISKISPALLVNANAVVRTDEHYFEILSKREAKIHHHMVITVLNEKGEEQHSEIGVGYDKFTRIMDIEGAIYDASGKLLKKLKGSDIKDFGYGAVGDDITDARMKVADFGKKSYPYPYTVELNYDTRDRNMMFYPKWTPLHAKKNAVEHSSFRIKTPAGFVFRYKEYNGAPPVKKSTEADGSLLYEWVMENRPVHEMKDYPLPDNEFLPMTLTAPSEFEIQDYSGSFNSWGDLSTFYYTLNKGRDVLPAATAAEIQTLVKGVKTDREKVLLLYKWMQSKTRYVSIQLGIGGWQTIDAATVATKGYGDCKALSNFMVASLKQAGITAYTALIKAGDEPEMNTDFPSSQFNHAIACVVLPKDTLWLECTSQTKSANFMGSFTGNRYALLVMPENGKLVPTRYYNSSQNSRDRISAVKIDDNGNGHLVVKTSYRGLQQETRESLLHNYSQDEQKKWLVSHLELPDIDLTKFEYFMANENIPVISEKLDLNVRNCAVRTGPRLFIKPNLLVRPLDLPASPDQNAGDFYLPISDYNLTDFDSLSFEVPEGMKLETTLPAFKIESVFGAYHVKSVFENNKLYYIRKMSLRGGRFQAADYPKWIEFIKKVRKADRSQVVLVEHKI
jgi:transglutaminase-like putative cysteine protease